MYKLMAIINKLTEFDKSFTESERMFVFEEELDLV